MSDTTVLSTTTARQASRGTGSGRGAAQCTGRRGASAASVDLVQACGDEEAVSQWAVAALEQLGPPPVSGDPAAQSAGRQRARTRRVLGGDVTGSAGVRCGRGRASAGFGSGKFLAPGGSAAGSLGAGPDRRPVRAHGGGLGAGPEGVGSSLGAVGSPSGAAVAVARDSFDGWLE